MGEPEFIRLAKRGRKRVGGGMRQVGFVAAMESYALHHNVERLEEDHLGQDYLQKNSIEMGFDNLRKEMLTQTLCTLAFQRTH